MAKEKDKAQTAEEAEFSTYHAAVPIDVDGSRAYNPGDVVPKSAVDSGLIDKAHVVDQPTVVAQPEVVSVSTTDQGADDKAADKPASKAAEQPPAEQSATATATATTPSGRTASR